ncbi:alpha/beta hydrolase [Candidatus Pacearchaeota archaeon]|nr:alpha/beta hydrolase [Candidatus Pacearchaeota archaeon]
MIKQIQFKNNKKQTLRGYIHIPKKYNTAIVYLHGFPGSCRGTSPPRVGRDFMKLGYLVLRFDFSGTDTSDGKFEDKLISQEVKDIKYAIDFLYKNYKFKNLILAGGSTGAIDAALYASKDKRINKLVLISGVSYLDQAANYDFSDRQVKDFWEKGYIIYKSNKGKNHWLHNKKLKKQFYDEFFKLDIPSSIKKFKKPILIIHGDKDPHIPVIKDPLELKSFSKKAKLKIIKGAGHQFKKPKNWKQVVSSIKKFIKK